MYPNRTMKDIDTLPGAPLEVMLSPNEQQIIETLRLLPGGATITITKNGRNSDVEFFMETVEKRLLKAAPSMNNQRAPFFSRRPPLNEDSYRPPLSKGESI